MALCLCLLNLSAQKVNEAKVKQQINAVASKMKTMQCDFVQTKYLKMLNDKMVSRGKMYYQQSNKLRWEYTYPYTYTFVLNGSRVLISKGKRNDVINVNQSKFFKEIARIMMNSVVGKCLTDGKDFKVSLTGSSAEYVATLYPKQKQMKQMFQKIILHFNKQKSTVFKVELIEKKGDRTIIELKNVKNNVPINAKVLVSISIALLSLLVLPLQAQQERHFPDSAGSKVKYNATIEMSKGYVSGVCIMANDGSVIKGSLFNEFGISAIDFTYQPDKKKVKLLSVIKILNKWYIKKVLRKDLVQVMENLSKGIYSYHDKKFKIDYNFPF